MKYSKFLIFISTALLISSCTSSPISTTPTEEGFTTIDDNTFIDQTTIDLSEIEHFKKDPRINYVESEWYFTRDSQGNITQVGFPKFPTKQTTVQIYTESPIKIPATVGDIVTTKNRGIFRDKGISPKTPITTWILFLIPNSANYLRDDLLMEEFWRQFVNLGNRIGDVSCTIWLTTKDCKSNDRYKCYNAEIAQKDYIDRFINTDELGPYVLITTKYPPRCSENDEVHVLYLKGIDVKYFSGILRELTDYIDNNYKNKKLSSKSLRLLEKKYWVPSQYLNYVFFVKKLVKELLS